MEKKPWVNPKYVKQVRAHAQERQQEMTQPTGQTYIIRNVDDLLQLNDRQLEACCKDLVTWVKFQRMVVTQLSAMKEHMEKLGVTEDMLRSEMQDHMAWIDDGVDGGELTVEVRDEDGNVHFQGTTNINGKGEVVA